MAKKKTKEEVVEKASPGFNDQINSRGRTFEGFVVKKFPRRIVVEFERTVYVKKYERFYRKRTRLHARLPFSLSDKISVGDYVKIMECRPLSKIIHFIVIEKIRDSDAMSKKALEIAKLEKEAKESKQVKKPEEKK